MLVLRIRQYRSVELFDMSHCALTRNSGMTFVNATLDPHLYQQHIPGIVRADFLTLQVRAELGLLGRKFQEVGLKMPEVDKSLRLTGTISANLHIMAMSTACNWREA